ncbi:TPA: ribosome small subunit-dependent GTPase A [Clostridium perfringens]|uniref:Small ribosomal subunit biogenesis GTPase RsgA n=5 Tax=Clostridium perfringens TaxID=1502 RepID=RSGA_CLOP1|nr:MULTISPECIES: ribosome small subunit-dependent GTPase A [Clostridium]Q0TPL7.1 RecName: Full=Small ribosomal subunit biogenesis GTPase RsgA [Clostridium perfringens ATCC 13124]ABG82922.1 ribosome small subunit-dependent GTPase A [Clostridium perfringens ATCC 13124]ALG49304.1 Ribosome small subunit-stimulated GTPase EngC [Clostridium perfringens]AMN36252.1 ribosome biogenesis GTPase RsgA [Clostridium perfringens]AQW27297.1 ribosome small subunit-dependent GTPase A [Clostridium perfringens]EG
MEGIIIKGIGGFYYIKTDEGIIECKARGKFRYNSLKPMVGDRVTIKVENGKGVIEDIHERSSELIRPTVANVTQAFVVFAIKNPDINLDLLNRFLTLCEYNDIHAVVCLNKEDLCTEEEKENLKELINDIGYEVLFINAKEGKGFDALKERLEHNITVLCGPSGAGKSTLLNSFIDREHMETGSVSEKIGRGKHTTRHSELIDVDNGYLVDTPGFTTLDVTFIDRDSLKYCFPEFNDYNNLCKFNGCNHYKEPKCAVKEAVEEGKINKLRYDFYIKTLEEIINRRGN